MEMEEKIGMVLVRASELRFKIANCIHKSTTNPLQSQLEGPLSHNNNNNNGDSSHPGDETDEETETLLDICDAFDFLESQLASLQVLRQQQQYQREALIGEIECSCKTLLQKLSNYNGEHADVMQEVEVFASMKVEHDTELLLPPYPTHSPSLVLDKNYLSRVHVPYSRKLPQNGLDGGSASKDSHSKPNKLWGGFRFLVHSTAKTMLTVVGVITLLGLAGFEPKLKNKGTNMNILTLFQQPDDKDEGLVSRCPPGKVAVMENGEIRWIVKERVEIPFDSAANDPDVSYGCG